MGQPVNPPIVAFNRGLISPKALARVDLDRARLSASVMKNWLPKTQGAMIIRPGTKFLGSSLNDTGAAWIPFIASTTSTALLELTDSKMRVWINDTLLQRPSVTASISITDTGWTNNSVGGTVAAEGENIIPTMTDYSTNGVTVSASSDNPNSSSVGDASAWNAADGDLVNTAWQDTGGGSTYPSWLNFDFDTGGGGGVAIANYAVQAAFGVFSDDAPKTWRLLASDYDTGTFGNDTGKWTMEDERSVSNWASSERREYTLPGADTGTVEAKRHWRLYVTSTEDARDVKVAGIEMYSQSALSNHVKDIAGTKHLNALGRGGIAETRKRVVVTDTGVEHSLDIDITRGPVQIRVGSSAGDDDYVSETNLATGYHNLAFTPETDFHVTLRTTETVKRIVNSISIGDTGTVEITTPWGNSNLDDIRHDQSADVVYVDCANIKPYKIERRGTGRSWSVVENVPSKGPYLRGRPSSAKLSIQETYGNTTINSDRTFFSSDHVGSLVRILHEGQGGKYVLNNTDAATDIINVTGISDTGASGLNERRIYWNVFGDFVGTVILERSFDSDEYGFNPVEGVSITDTGSGEYQDEDDNISVWYRFRVSDWTSGTIIIDTDYANGFSEGEARITGYNSNTSVEVEVLENFSDTAGSDVWSVGAWSGAYGYPTAVSLHEGRLCHAGRATVWGSVSDDYQNHNADTVGDAGPIDRTLGSGPVDQITFLASLSRLVAGTAGSEIAIRSSSLDEPLTPSNSSARQFSTQGSGNVPAARIDDKLFFVQRSGKKIFSVGEGDQFSNYVSEDLTLLVPDLLAAGVVDIAVQRQPDTRLHCVLANGKVAILTYEPQEEVIAWSEWETDTGLDSAVERVSVLPEDEEDAVYYHVRRTINGSVKRFLEKWAMESETAGDTGLTWISDCAVSQTDTGASNTMAVDHLIGAKVVAWANDTGQGNSYGKDLSPDDTGGAPVTYTVDTGGDITLGESVKHKVAGLGFNADFKTTKLAYGAQMGTALAQWKRVEAMAFILYQTHNNGVFFGSDTGYLDPLPRVIDEGGAVDKDKILQEFDQMSMAFPGGWDTDSRVHIRGKAPRPATIMAAIPTVVTNEKA